jgi:cytochrome P450
MRPAFSSDKNIEFAPRYLPPHGAPRHRLLYQHHTTSLVFNDPPLHTRVRKLIMGALTRRAIAEMEAGLVALVDSCSTAEAPGGGDLIEDFASAIPVEVIGNLLGVPHADRGRCAAGRWPFWARWSRPEPEQQALGNRSVLRVSGLPDKPGGERRRQPGDPEHDVLTRLIQGEADGEAAVRGRTAAQLHLHPQRRPRDHHQPDRQRAGALQEWPDAKTGLLRGLHGTAPTPGAGNAC